MKLVKCVIRAEKVDEVVSALRNVVSGMTVSTVRGYGHQKGHSVMYRGVEYAVALLPKIMVEIVAEDNRVEDIIGVIAGAARTGEIGDGRIFVLPVEAAFDVRTGFMDLD